MAGALKICEPMIAGCNYNGSRPNLDDSTGEVIDWVLCLNAYTLCNIGLITPVQMSGVNPYDVRRQCGSDPLCYDFSAIDGYLNQDDVKEALGVTGEWAECSHLVDLIMVYGGDWMKEFQDRVTDLLDGGVDVLVYAGEYDFICNWLGNKAWTQTLPWSGATEYANAVNTTWTTASGDVAGSFLSGGGMVSEQHSTFARHILRLDTLAYLYRPPTISYPAPRLSSRFSTPDTWSHGTSLRTPSTWCSSTSTDSSTPRTACIIERLRFGKSQNFRPVRIHTLGKWFRRIHFYHPFLPSSPRR